MSNPYLPLIRAIYSGRRIDSLAHIPDCPVPLGVRGLAPAHGRTGQPCVYVHLSKPPDSWQRPRDGCLRGGPWAEFRHHAKPRNCGVKSSFLHREALRQSFVMALSEICAKAHQKKRPRGCRRLFVSIKLNLAPKRQTLGSGSFPAWAEGVFFALCLWVAVQLGFIQTTGILHHRGSCGGFATHHALNFFRR